jgi:hypothetical protein
MLTVNEFKVKSRAWRLERFPRNGVITPLSCLSTRDEEMTFDKGSQAIPDHAVLKTNTNLVH